MGSADLKLEVVVVPVVDVDLANDMAELDDATQFKELVDRPGTGHVTQLPPPRRAQATDLRDAERRWPRCRPPRRRGR